MLPLFKDKGTVKYGFVGCAHVGIPVFFYEILPSGGKTVVSKIGQKVRGWVCQINNKCLVVNSLNSNTVRVFILAQIIILSALDIVGGKGIFSGGLRIQQAFEPILKITCGNGFPVAPLCIPQSKGIGFPVGGNHPFGGGCGHQLPLVHTHQVIKNVVADGEGGGGVALLRIKRRDFRFHTKRKGLRSKQRKGRYKNND